MTQLEASRVAAVDSAEAERRRIERDLHDGAQQRLVALAMDLGMAREKLDPDPDGRPGARRRGPRRGQAGPRRAARPRAGHPPCDPRRPRPRRRPVRGRRPLPGARSTLSVDVAERPPPAIEGTAYFVVSEALTNVAKHAGATRGVGRPSPASGDRLVIEVSDDGHGGADAGRRQRPRAACADRVAAARRLDARRQPARRTDHPHRGAPVRIVIAEDAVLLRAGLTRLLADAGEEVVAAVGDARRAARRRRAPPARPRHRRRADAADATPTRACGPRSRIRRPLARRRRARALASTSRSAYATELLAGDTAGSATS